MRQQSYLFDVDDLGFRPIVETDLNYLVLLDADPEIMSFSQMALELKKKSEITLKDT